MTNLDNSKWNNKAEADYVDGYTEYQDINPKGDLKKFLVYYSELLDWSIIKEQVFEGNEAEYNAYRDRFEAEIAVLFPELFPKLTFP
jgi:hypothetical protein